MWQRIFKIINSKGNRDMRKSKTIIALLLCLMMILAACGNAPDSSQTETTEEPTESEEEQPPAMKWGEYKVYNDGDLSVGFYQQGKWYIFCVMASGGLDGLGKYLGPENFALETHGFGELKGVINHYMERADKTEDTIEGHPAVIYSSYDKDTSSNIGVAVFTDDYGHGVVWYMSDTIEGITHRYDGEITGEVETIKPLDESDFINKESNNPEFIDVFEDFRNYDEEMLQLYFDPQEDESKEAVVTTARGIHIGDTREAVENAYGKDYTFHEDLESCFFYGDDLDTLLRVTALSHIHYFTDSGYGITFCFDDHNEVTWIIFTDPSYEEQLK